MLWVCWLTVLKMQGVSIKYLWREENGGQEAIGVRKVHLESLSVFPRLRSLAVFVKNPEPRISNEVELSPAFEGDWLAATKTKHVIYFSLHIIHYILRDLWPCTPVLIAFMWSVCPCKGCLLLFLLYQDKQEDLPVIIFGRLCFKNG